MSEFEKVFPKPLRKVCFTEINEWLLQLEGWQKCAAHFTKILNNKILANEAKMLEGYLPAGFF